jgi:site-specific DNA recombinase
MKTAIIYIRVSTDEQADTGYSQRHQEEMLRRYCELQHIHIIKTYFEDHSAKNFERPEFKKLLIQIRKEKNITDLLLFTKWDRFSRNAGDAYAMISTLNKLGVEPQAIEQPLDISVPENKMMLAFYLAAPEVENDRRSLNVSTGMRRAKKEGRWMGTAPIGYINKQADKKKWIEIDPVNGPLIKQAFEEVALGKYSTESILKFTRARGITCSKNNFWSLLRNPVYCGKIFVPAYKHEEAAIITGQHLPLISEALFHQVQDVLDGKKKTQRTKKTVDDNFPLRGFINCPACNKQLTASCSRGKKGKLYPYYHCTSTCGTRFPAATLENDFIQELAKWKPHPAIKELYKLILADVLEQNRRHQKQELINTQQQLKHYADKLTRARELVLASAIEPDDFKIIKRECEANTSKLEANVAELMQQQTDITPLIDTSVSLLENLDQQYITSSTYKKREIVSSIFPEKLIYTTSGYRTQRVNEAVQVIYSLGAAFSEIKMGQVKGLSDLSHEVIPLGLEPRAPTLKVLCSTN